MDKYFKVKEDQNNNWCAMFWYNITKYILEQKEIKGLFRNKGIFCANASEKY